MRSAILLLALALPVTAHAATELKAGVARVEITPSTFMPMYGYADRKCGPANGTHDPLFAKVLVLEAGGSRMALVSTDLGSLVSEILRRDVASKLGIPVLLL
jgi:neutral ceramidase